MERDRATRSSSSSNRHNTRAASAATATASESSNSSKNTQPSSSNAASASSGLKRSGSIADSSATKRGRSTTSHAQDESATDNTEASSTTESSRKKDKGKAREVALPSSLSTTRRSSRHTSQPSHAPTLVSKAAKAAVASSSSSRSGKRPATELETNSDSQASKRNKPNPIPTSSRRPPTASSSSRMTPKRNSAASSASSSTHSQLHGKGAGGKGKSRSGRAGRTSSHGSSHLISAAPSGSASNMDNQCGHGLDDAEDAHLEVKSDVSQSEGGAPVSKKKSSASLTNDAAAADTEAKTGKSGDAAAVKEEVGGDDQDGVRDDDEEDDDEGDGDEHFEDEAEDDYDDGHDVPGDDGAFGMNLRAMAGYMSGLTGRFRSLLAALRARDDPQGQLGALQELSDLLIVSTEDSLAGYFPIDSFVRELIYIMGGPKPAEQSGGISSLRQLREGGSSRGGAGAGGANASLQDEDSTGAGESSVVIKRDQTEDDDAAMAAALAAAGGFEDNGEVMLIACRCLANLMEAMPYATHSVVSCGAIPVLCSKLIEITFIDLAEQVLQTLEKISLDFPAAIVKEGGLNAMLQFLDFFNIHVQRTAMTTAANCCRKLTSDSFSMVLDIMPIVQNVLSYADQRLVESACKCVVRIIDSYRHQPELLERLITPELVGPLCELLLAASGGSGASTASVIIGSNTHTEVLKALGSASKASPQVAVTLLDQNIVETLYQLLTGSAPPRDVNAQSVEPVTVPALSIEDVPSDSAISAAVAVVPEGSNTGAVTVADMAILQNLAQRPKEQVQDALSLIAELLPPLPRDGIFDARAYSERAHKRMMQRAKDKERDARRAARSARKAANTDAASPSGGARDKSAQLDGGGDVDMADAMVTDASNEAAAATSEADGEAEAGTSGGQDGVTASDPFQEAGPSNTSGPSLSSTKSERVKSEREVAKEAANTKRIDKLKEHEGPVRRFSQLMLPTLVEVYSASVTLHVRTKALNAILKITSFVEAEDLATILKDVPVANFIADILSSREHASLVQAALQMVELLFVKLPDVYQTVLRREGVMFEVDDIAAREPAGKGKAPEKGGDKPTAVKSEPVTVALPSTTSTASTSSGAAAQSGPAAGSSSNALKARDVLATFESSASGRGTYSTMINMAATEADDANIWRARTLRDRFAAETSNTDGGKRAGEALNEIKQLVASLDDKTVANVEETKDVLRRVAELFGKREEPISSFELLKSGLIEGLYRFSTSRDFALDLQERRTMLMDAFMTANSGGVTPASVLVRRLQESLSRLENVDITTAMSSVVDDTRRSPTSILAKQLRLRLVAEDSTDVPRSCHQVVVTIHAIASFQSLNDYLRPKIAASAVGGSTSGGGASGSGIRSAVDADTSSRLSNILAALSAAGNGLDSQLSAASALRQSLAALSAGIPATASATSSAAPASGDTARVTAAESSKTANTAESSDKTVRRRSSRLESQAGEASSSTARRSGEESTTNAEPTDAPRRSSAGDATEDPDPSGEGLASAIETDEVLARRLVEGLLNEGYDEDMFTEDEYEEEVLEDELPPDGGIDTADKAVTLKVDSNGDVEAETSTAAEGGNDAAEASTSAAGAGTDSAARGGATAASSSGSRPTRSSYAAALQRKPSDWHLEFFMDGKPIKLTSTIYGAVHNFEASRTSTQAVPRYIWQNVYTVTYKKVPGPAPSEESDATPEPEEARDVAVTLPESVPKDAPYATILQLLGVMHDLNTTWREEHELGSKVLEVAAEKPAPPLAESAFINNKLTAKLNRQLEEPMIVASSCLPGWCVDLPRAFPFLFPFEARYSYLQSTSFGYARLLTKWQNQHSRAQDGASSRRDDSFGFLSRLQRQKVRISRSRLFESAMKVFELYGHSTSVLEVEYFEEVGTGLGPTLEFYALVSREFARRDLGLWRDDGSAGGSGNYVNTSKGLFPAPMSAAQLETDEGKQRLAMFRTLGQFVAKALLDSRIIDCNFSTLFMKAVLSASVPATLGSVRAVDPGLARSMEQVLAMDANTLSGMALDFTLPGHPSIELVEGGKSKTVDKDNVHEYVDAIVRQTVRDGIQPAVRAFRRGFNSILPLQALSSFTPEELVMLFGNMDEDWSEATLLAAIKPDHGFNSESAAFRDLVSIMSSFDVRKRREFLQWLTGSPKLPIGGFAGLNPQLTMVKRPHEAPLMPDDYLPSVMTCVNYLKMPGYSSREKMRLRLETAMAEGSGSFYLS